MFMAHVSGVRCSASASGVVHAWLLVLLQPVHAHHMTLYHLPALDLARGVRTGHAVSALRLYLSKHSMRKRIHVFITERIPRALATICDLDVNTVTPPTAGKLTVTRQPPQIQDRVPNNRAGAKRSIFTEMNVQKHIFAKTNILYDNDKQLTKPGHLKSCASYSFWL